MVCYSETFRLMTRYVKQTANALCAGRLVLCHEGGYPSVYAPWCALAIIEELSGAQPHQAEVMRSRPG
jgi:acetoin utilization deacetylase AcuC-like enzyme